MTAAAVTSIWEAVFTAKENLLPYASDLSASFWTKSGTSASAAATTNPLDGASDAFLVYEDTSNAQHRLFSSFLTTVVNGLSYKLSFYLKAAGRTKIEIYFGGTAFSSPSGTFDLTAETATGHSCTAAIEGLTGGWYLCSITATASASGTFRLDAYFYGPGGSISAYVGDGASGFYMYGPQMQRASIDEGYITTLTNPVTPSEINSDYSALAYPYDITQRSEAELTELYQNQEVNFFTYLVQRVPTPQMTGVIEYVYRVEVNYYLYKDEAGSNYQELRNAFEAIDTVVRSQLGKTWSGTVDYWRTDNTPIEITTEQIGGDDCYRGRYVYTGFKRSTIS